jgi:hypothetical protein
MKKKEWVLNKWWKKAVYVIGWIEVGIFLIGLLLGMVSVLAGI